MAQITMDSSEWEAMKKVEKLLEDSLEKERGLTEEIKTLNLEKIQALEDAKMKVVKKTYRETREMKYLKVEPEVLVQRLKQVFGRGREYGSISDYQTSSQHAPMSSSMQGMYAEDLIRSAFGESVSHSIEDDVTITLHGLDEVKEELREDIKSKIDAQVQKDLKDAVNAMEKHGELLKLNKKLTKDLERETGAKETLQVLNDDLVAENKFNQSLIEQNSKRAIAFTVIRNELKNRPGLFDRASFIEKLRTLTIEPDEQHT